MGLIGGEMPSAWPDISGRFCALHVCRGVGIPFIGIATDSRAARLSAEGAVCVFPDFSDTDLFLSSLYETTNVA